MPITERPNGAAVEITSFLIEVYQDNCYPTPFRPELGDLEIATLVRNRMTGIPFSPYWGDIFNGFRNNQGNPTGPFAIKVLEAAKIQEGSTLLATVATELAGSFGEAVLSAEFDIPLLEEPQPPSPLAQFLIDRRRELEDSTTLLHPRLPMISPAWMRLAHTLASTDPTKHDQLLKEIAQEYNRAYNDGTQAIEEEAGILGGFDDFGREHLVSVALAQTLARHYPEIVVSRLREPVALIAQ